VAIDFFVVSESYLARDAEKEIRQKALAARGIVALYLGDDYTYLEKRDLPLIQAHLKKEGLPHSKDMVRNLARFFRLNFLALNGDKKSIEYLDNVCQGLLWMKIPREDLAQDGIKTWQDVRVRWRAKEETTFCLGCPAKREEASFLDELEICQRQIERLREAVADLTLEKKELLTELKAVKSTGERIYGELLALKSKRSLV